MNTVDTLGEAALIERLTARLASGPDVAVGPGDDCAVIHAGKEDWLLTSDPVIEGVHFLADTAPVQVGHKAVARALSDIAAMGGTPRWGLVNLVVPPTTKAVRLDGIYEGMAATATTHGLTIVGGDVAQGATLELHVFAVGSLPRGSAVLRSGAAPGDVIFVTGALGGSRIGDHHLTFVPRLSEGAWLRQGEWASAMCDISDGLSTDLHHLTTMSGVGAEIELAAIPCSPSATSNADPVTHALEDGEDFELLFTVPQAKVPAFAEAWTGTQSVTCTRLGTVVSGTDITAVQFDGTRRVVMPAGYDHFADRRERA